MTSEEAEKNRQHLDRFCDYWKKRKGRLELKGNGMIIFRANIVYEFHQNNKSIRLEEITGVIIQRNAQPGPGKVSLEEAGPLVTELLHLEFSPDFQRYRLGKVTRSLLIRGDTSKMGGAYKVKLKPVKPDGKGLGRVDGFHQHQPAHKADYS